jgi:hypothetical protein
MQNNRQRSCAWPQGCFRVADGILILPAAKKTEEKLTFGVSIKMKWFNLDGEAARKSGSASRHCCSYFAGGTALFLLSVGQHAIPGRDVSVTNMP